MANFRFKFLGEYYKTTDVEKSYRELHAKGVEFVQKSKKESWGMSALFKDIDGNVFCIGSED